MAQALTKTEKKILKAVQHGLPLTLTPYHDIAEQTSIEIDKVLEILSAWQKDGKIRRIGAIINHFEVGLSSGAMVAWNVPEEQTEKTGSVFASFTEISHAYLRPVKKNWPYNMYTMIHSSDNTELKTTIEKIKNKTGITNCKILRTIRELKKVPPSYV